MTIEQTPLEGCFVIHEKVNGDARGYFIETYNQRDFKLQQDWISNLFKITNRVHLKGY